MSRLLTVAAAAKEADCNSETLLRAIRTKELVATRHATKPGRPYQIEAGELAAFLKRRRVIPGAPAA